MRHKCLNLAVAACALIPHTAWAQDTNHGFEFSANTAIVSDYVFRGISQSDENFALQGGFDVVHETGLYTGVWASSVDFNDGDEATVETDLYAGYSGELNNFTYDVRGIYYAYPGADSSRNYDFFELHGSLGYDFDVASAVASLNYSPEYFGDSGDATYARLAVDVPLPHSFTLSGGVGRQDIDDNAAFGVQDYTDWNLTLGYDWQKFNFSLGYHDTDLEEPRECADGCGARVVFAISASF